jgi:hypothetical protein
MTLEPLPTNHVPLFSWEDLHMAVNKLSGDSARKGAIKKRSQTKTTIAGSSGYTKRDRSSGEFMAVKKPTKAKKAAKNFKDVRVEKNCARKKARRG